MTLGDGGVTAAQPLPFDFVLYGASYRQFHVAANGLAGFVNQALSASANTDLTNAAAPNAIIAPYWADLNPAQGGQVRAGILGAAPNRRAVISWVDVPVKGSTLILLLCRSPVRRPIRTPMTLAQFIIRNC